jgi:hypothetical protein
MSFCLECHRKPEPKLRPVDEVTNMAWKPEYDPLFYGNELREENKVHTRTSCTTCHR